ncbi:MAG: glucosamine-6-phosphate deaminase [Lachnospiraceae bacterium]|nr:glucosamine-6-phosphate deaminase [Lachnospiraceae bacterium]
MKFIKCKDYDEMSIRAAEVLEAVVKEKPDCVLGLATGSTPVGMYSRLIEDCKAGKIDFSKCTSVNLDEYVGLGEKDDQSYRYFMNTNLFDHINIDKAKTFVPNGLESNADKACSDYEAILEKTGPQDIQVLGLGENGHIAFNEPETYFPKLTHRVDLTESTIEANARFFENQDKVPRHAYSMGIGSIFRAKKILLLASGAKKAKALKEALNGPIDPKLPASILQLHPDVVVVCDEAAMQ